MMFSLSYGHWTQHCDRGTTRNDTAFDQSGSISFTEHLMVCHLRYFKTYRYRIIQEFSVHQSSIVPRADPSCTL